MRIRGDTVSVLPRLRDSRDSFGNHVEAWGDPVEVGGVIIAPGKCEALDATRPEGVVVALTLHFPKTWAGSLRGAKVVLAGRYDGVYRVVGDPKPYGGYIGRRFKRNMPVEVEAADG